MSSRPGIASRSSAAGLLAQPRDQPLVAVLTLADVVKVALAVVEVTVKGLVNRDQRATYPRAGWTVVHRAA
jgi:hypothetical protein